FSLMQPPSVETPVTPMELASNYPEPLGTGEVQPQFAIDVLTSDGEAQETSKDTTAEADSAEESSDTKPAWVTLPPKRVGNVYRRVLQAGPYATADECQQYIRSGIELAVKQYIGEMADAEMHGRASHPSLDRLGISLRYIQERIVSEEYYETVRSSVSDDMKTLHVLLEIDHRTHSDLMQHWRAYERRDRIAGVAVLSGGLLAALAGVLGLIKLDTHTKGYYTKRLFIGVPLAIIGLLILTAELWDGLFL
ncbi:MAG: hypothetical protein ACR2NU_08275, partial [Aeoliella sp.]